MGNMELFKLELEPALTLAEDLWLIDLAVYLPETKALVIADLHLGYEEALRREGVLVPPGHLRKVEARLLKILRGLGMSPFPRPERLIINGDLKHSFSPLSRREGEEAEEFLEFAAAEFAELVLLRGNHDKNLEPIEERSRQSKGDLTIREWLKEREGRLLITHGDREPRGEELEGVELVLIGHEHPAVGLRSKTGRRETYKAFLLGAYRGRGLLVQPSFNLLVRGTDLTREGVLSPLLGEAHLERFLVYPVSDEGEIYPLGELALLTSASGFPGSGRERHAFPSARVSRLMGFDAGGIGLIV